MTKSVSVTVVNGPSLASFTSFDPATNQPLHSVSVGPGDDVWIGGEQGAVAHLESGTFKAVAVGSPFTVNAIWVDEIGSPWACGGAGKVRVRTGGGWVNHDVTATSIKSVWGRSSTDVYAGGDSVYHFNGTTWADTNFSGNGAGAVALWGTNSRLFAFDGSVWELVGTTWKFVGSRSLLAEGPIFVQGKTLWTTELDGTGLSMDVIRWNGTTWDKLRLPDSDGYGPTALAASPSGEAWAFGPASAIRHRAAP